jgi:hypothetical protein
MIQLLRISGIAIKPGWLKKGSDAKIRNTWPGDLTYHSVAADSGHNVHHDLAVLLPVHLVGPVLGPHVI